MYRLRPLVRLGVRHFSAPATTRMNLFTAVNDAMRVALQTDESAIVFGEVRITFGKIILCCVGCSLWWCVSLQCRAQGRIRCTPCV